MLRLAVVLVAAALVATACGAGGAAPPATTRGPAEQLITQADLDRVPEGSPPRALLAWWRNAQFANLTAYVDGFQCALDEGYDVVFEMDADRSHDPAYIPRFLDAIRGGADVVLGSRNVPGGGVEGWGLGRHVLSKGGSLYARTILGVGVRDLTTGYKAFTRRALAAIDPASVRSNGYSFQIETTYRALRKGLRVVEVPIVFVDRRAGRSKMSRRIFAEAIMEVWRLRVDALTGRI